MKRIISVILTLTLLVCGLSVSGYALNDEPSIMPNYVGLVSVSAMLDIDSNGRALCYAAASADPGYHMYLTMELQRLESGTWTTIYSWSTDGYNRISLEKYRYVGSGYDYRVVARVRVFDSAGDLVEFASAISGVDHY